MELLPSLCSAMVRVGGDTLVLVEGAPPHALTATGRHDVAKAVLSRNAVEALLGQIFSDESRRILAETGAVSEPVDVREPAMVVTATAERTGTTLRIELSRHPEVADAPEPEAAPDVAVATTIDVEPLPSPEELSLASGHLALAPSGQVDTEAADAPPEAAPGPQMWTSPVEVVAPLPDPRDGTTDDEQPQADAEPPQAAPAVSATLTAPEVAPTTAAVMAREPFSTPPPVPSQPALVSHVTTTSDNTLARWIQQAAAQNATALYLRTGVPVVARVEGRLVSLDAEALTTAAFERASSELGRGEWTLSPDGSWSCEDHAAGRVRCRAFKDDQGSGLVLSLLKPPTTPALHRLIPRRVKAACDGDGLVVVGASTPADVLALGAATADWAGARRGGYVLALRQAGTARPHISGDFVSQRELPGNDHEVAAAIRAAAAEAPDVLLVVAPTGDAAMREAILAADSGCLVIVAVLAQSSIQALRTLAGRSLSGGDAPNRLALATAFRAAFSHRLLRRLRGGQTLVQDLILGTSAVSALLASGDLAGVSRLQRSSAEGMCTVDATLARAVKRGHLSLRQATSQASDRGYMVSLVRAARRARTAPQGVRLPGAVVGFGARTETHVSH